jgi:hypothetical protein
MSSCSAEKERVLRIKKLEDRPLAGLELLGVKRLNLTARLQTRPQVAQFAPRRGNGAVGLADVRLNLVPGVGVAGPRLADARFDFALLALGIAGIKQGVGEHDHPAGIVFGARVGGDVGVGARLKFQIDAGPAIAIDDVKLMLRGAHRVGQGQQSRVAGQGPVDGVIGRGCKVGNHRRWRLKSARSDAGQTLKRILGGIEVGGQVGSR